MTTVQQVHIEVGPTAVAGDLNLPDTASAVVVFAHGSGSGRLSPRNRMVAAALNDRGLGTLLLDLLTPAEEQARAQFDIDLLASRLAQAQRWLAVEVGPRRVGYFGASTGAAAALVAAAEAGDRISAIVSRGGRPDLAGSALPRVNAPTLLIVGGDDTAVLDLNWQAAARMQCPRRLEIVPGATHLFAEPGALEQVAELAADWFGTHLHPDAEEARR